MAADQGYEWELSKENVQPLSGGRRIANLTAALQNPTDQTSKLREEKRQFEIELRTYTGDDPLSVWYQYIEWIEQNFPSGAGPNNKSQLIEQCVKQFKDDDRYKNDQRYIEIWVKFAHLCSDANELFSFMFNNCIGTELAFFYIAWASELETIENYKRADAIYKEGIEKFAQPRDLIIKRHGDFQARVAAKMARGDISTEGAAANSSTGQDAENRVTLGGLKGHGKTKKVGSVRQSTSKSSAIGSLHASGSGSNVKGPGFTIYQEQENRPSNLPPQTGDWGKVPVQAEINRENQMKPGKWTDARIRQKSSGIGASATPVPSTPSFKVHTDEEAGLSTVTPRKQPPMVNQVLSARKPDKPKDPLQHLVGKSDSDSSSVPMYCKHLIYVGMNEFSFEELRAIAVQRKEEAENQRRLKEERLQMEKELQQQRDQLAQLMQEKMKMEEEVQRIKVTGTRMDSSDEIMSGNTNTAVKSESPAPVGAMQNMNASANAPVEASLQLRATRVESPMETDCRVAVSEPSPVVCEPSPVRQGLIRPGIATPEDKTALLLGTSAFTTFTDGSIQATPESSDFSGNKSGSKKMMNPGSWGGIAGPSPTVNTKNALQAVLGMFTEDIVIKNSDLGFDDSGQDGFSDPIPSAPISAPRFAIFDENKESPPASLSKTPFTIFDENAASNRSAGPQPPKVLRRGLMPREELLREDRLHAMPSPTRPPIPITDQSVIIENQPLLEEGDVDMEDDPIIAFPACMTMMTDKNLEDMTFAPGFSSTQNFSKIARLMSTPFNPAGESPPPPNVPPVSMIQEEGCHYGLEKTAPGFEFTLGDTLGPAQTNCSKAPAQEFTPENPEDSGSSHGQKHMSNLSPITELSGEDNKLGLSNMSAVKLDQGESQKHNGAAAATTMEPSPPARKESPQLMNQTCHEIDVTCYQPDETPDMLSQSVMVSPYSDPFDAELIEDLLLKVDKPIELYSNYHTVPDTMPNFKARQCVSLGNDDYEILRKIGCGAYAQVYEVTKADNESKPLVMKVQKPPCPWEFYVISELHRRIKGSRVASSVMSVDDAYFFEDGSCLINELFPHGTLLDVVNYVREENVSLPEPCILLLCIELLRILEAMMAVDFIHGDIKPDNFLFRGFPSMDCSPEEFLAGDTECLKLIDFGRGIDMRLFPEGTTFGVAVETSGFQCIEMKTARPWTYQTDMFGIIGTMHVLIFKEYMAVNMQNGVWKTGTKFRRWLTSSAYISELFEAFLNVKSCSELPDVPKYRKQLEKIFLSSYARKYQSAFTNLLLQKLRK